MNIFTIDSPWQLFEFFLLNWAPINRIAFFSPLAFNILDSRNSVIERATLSSDEFETSDHLKLNSNVSLSLHGIMLCLFFLLLLCPLNGFAFNSTLKLGFEFRSTHA